MSQLIDRVVGITKDALNELHPKNFLLQPSTLTTLSTSQQPIPTIIRNINTESTAHAIYTYHNSTGITTSISNLSTTIPSPVIIPTLLSSSPSILSLPFSPITMIKNTFILPPQFLQAIIIMALIFLSITVLLYTIYTCFHRAIYGATNNIPIQVLDVATFDGFKPEWRVSNEMWFERATARFHLHDDEIRFMNSITERSGIGHATHFSPGIVEFPADLSLQAARKEAEIVMYHCIDKLLAENNLKPEDVDILVSNCSLFNPTPSITSMIINHYNFRTDIQSFHLGGMGCGISPLSVNVAATCLRLHPKKHPIAIVVSMENITQNIYMGRERAFMLQNALFRLGGAAVLLTRDTTAVLGRPAPKWTIEHSTHIHTAQNTDAYTCVFQDIDKEDRQGVRLDKALMSVAAGAITRNLSIVGSKILPIRGIIDYVFRVSVRFIKIQLSKYSKSSLLSSLSPSTSIPTPATECLERLPPIVPNFKLAVQHFCIHAGGRAVLSAIQDALHLTDADMKPSRDTLYKYGNTSSSSIWYEYKQVEMTRKPRKNDVMLLIAVGSGFKANLLIFRALRDISSPEK